HQVVAFRNGADGTVEIIASAEIPGGVGVQVASLHDETQAHHVGPDRWLPTSEILVVPGGPEGIRKIGQVVRPVEPAAFILVKCGEFDTAEVACQRTEEDE